MEAFELVLPEEFLRLRGNIFELIKESTAVLTDAREIVLEVRDFQKLKNFLKKKKVRGLAIKTKWFDIGSQNFRAVVYPRGNSETRSHLSFFIQKQQSVDSFDSTSYLLYTLSIQRNGGNLTKVSNGRFHDEGEYGWVDFVDLGLLLERDSGYLIENTAIRFHARINILEEWFCKGKEAAKLHGFEIEEPMKQEPFVWHVSNLSEILALTSIVVSPSFRLGKFPLNMVVFEKDGFVRGRLFSTVSDFDESWEIVYSFFVSVRGEVTIRDSRATLRPKSSENRDVRFFETTEIQQGCEVVLTCLLLSLTKLGENDHEAGVSRDIDLSPEQPLRSSSSSLNLPDSSSEPGVSSRIASLEAASLQIIAMQEKLHQIMNMQKEMQKQMITAQDNENIRLEIAVGKSMEKSLEANTDALWTLLQEENAKQEKLAREWTQQMISLISNCLNNLPALVEKAVKKEFSTVGSSVARMISPAIEKAVSVAIPEAFQKWVGDKAVNQLEKSVNLKIEATVARQIQAQFQTSGKRALQETLKSSLEASVIPAFEMSCKAMFEQVATTFQKGMIHPATEAQQQFESALRDAINSTSSLTQTLSGELADGQRKLLALAAAGANSKAVNPLVTQLGNGPLGGLHDKIEAPLDLTKELSRLVSEHKYEEAFTAALQRSDVSIVSWLCSQVDLQWILATVPLPLSQGVLLSLLQQLACDISKNTTRKLVWMTEVAIALNPTDPMIAVHVQPIFEQVYQILNHHRSLPTASSTELSLIRLLMHVINSMLMSEFISKFRSFLVFVDRWEKI